MLTVVCWKWNQPGYRSKFSGMHVNVLAAMVERNYQQPHDFVCITDDADGINTKQVRVIPLWKELGGLLNPSFPGGPSCYRRLKAFSKEAGELIGERFVSLDLDCVITGDMTPVWDRPEDFVIWGDTIYPGHYNGSMWMLRAGTRTKVWEKFNPATSPRAAHQAGKRGSDQGWLSYVLGPGEAMWTKADGVYSYRMHVKKSNRLPENAKIVLFHGNIDPWSYEAQRLDWVRNNWRF